MNKHVYTYSVYSTLIPLTFISLITSIITISMHMPFKAPDWHRHSTTALSYPTPLTNHNKSNQATFPSVKWAVDSLRDVNAKIRDRLHHAFTEDLHQLIYRIAKEEDINPNLIWSMIKVESAGSQTRYEPRVAINRAMADINLKPEDRQAMASSHGLMQIMGYNASQCNLSWKDLYQPELNIRCGLKLLKGWIRASTGKNARERLYNALAKYNGGYRPASMSYAYALKVLNGI